MSLFLALSTNHFFVVREFLNVSFDGMAALFSDLVLRMGMETSGDAVERNLEDDRVLLLRALTVICIQ